MFKLDNALLEELGLGSLPAHEKNKMLAHIYETLEMRVGMKLAEQMSNEQLDEFEGFIDKNDEAGALKWLETNFPNYKQVVADQLELLKGEVRQAAPHIVAAAQQNAAVNAQPPSMVPGPQPAWQPPAPSVNPMPPSMPDPTPEPFPPQPTPPMAPPAQLFPSPAPQPPATPMPADGGYQAPNPPTNQPPYQPMPPQWQPPAPSAPTQPAPSDDPSQAWPAA